MKKLGIVLSGGVARGIANLGFLKVLEEHKIPIHCIAATSMGAVIGSAYALKQDIDDLRKIIAKIRNRHVVDVNIFALTGNSLLRSKKIKKIVEGYLKDAEIEDCKINFACNAADLISGEEVVYTQGRMADRVLASSAIPGVFRPFKIDGKLLCDGGTVCRMPVHLARKMGADAVVCCDVIEDTVVPEKKLRRFYRIIPRSHEIMDRHLMRLYFEVNKPELIVTPNMPGLDMFDFNSLDKMYDAGYKAGVENIERIKSLLNNE